MKFIKTETKEVDVRYLYVFAAVRYWEDTEVNGVPDETGKMIPCRVNDLWCPRIDLAEGRITNWEQGVIASIHYKVCDAGEYQLIAEGGEVISERKNGYVPSCLDLDESGYGDYIIMEVNENGFILNWVPDLSDFS